MKQLKVLLACGSGASSGFMASNMRKAAAENNVDADIHAVSDSEIPEYIDKVDVIMLGPHVKYLEEELKKKAAVYGVPVACISQQAYGILDGKRALSETIKIYKASKAGEQQ